MPKPEKFSLKMIGPGIVLIAMGLGSGEFILWPFLVSKYGFGVIWGAILGITFQYFVSNETGRYTLATGGSIYSAFYKLNKYLPWWFILSTFASFAWPGIIGSGGKILEYLLGMEGKSIFGVGIGNGLTVLMLLVIGLLLTFGGKVYNSLEKMQKLFIIIAIPTLVLIVILIINPDVFIEIAKGSVGFGDGFFLLPSDISILAFLGSVAYSGAAGNLVLSHSFYIQDKGLGMSSKMDTQVSRLNHSKGVPEGIEFEPTEKNVKYFKTWFRNAAIEQLISFWFVGLVTIFLLTITAYQLLFPYTGVDGLNFIFLQASILKDQVGQLISVAFLAIGVVFLFTTQLGIFETTSRIMTENIQLGSKSISKNYDRSSIYYFFLWAQIATAIAITLFGFSQPLQILIIGTFFSALSMFVLSLLVYLLNTSTILPKQIHPGDSRKLVLLTSVVFFGIFVIVTLVEEFL